jgi:lysozyme
MITVCATGTTIKGFDISHWQPTVDFTGLKAAGNAFCFIKASEGVGTDISFDSHWPNAKKAGLITGAYHFFRAAVNPLEQARTFADKVGKLGPEDLPCVMDWEVTDGTATQLDRENGLQFLHSVEALTGKTPLIYGGPYFLTALALDPQFMRFGLWVAHYGPKCPLVPLPWHSWEFWQWNGTGTDNNLFNGTLDQLKELATGPLISGAV